MEKKQVILVVDTATEFCSVALQAHNQVFVRQLLAPQKHAALVLGMVDEVLSEAKVERSQIELIGFGKGPGSFTGVRIACSVAQGLALGLDKPVFGCDELKLLAMAGLAKAQEAAPADAVRFAIGSIDARMGEVYYALFKAEGHKVEQLVDTKVGAPAQALSEINAALQEAGVTDTSQVIGAGTGIAILKEHGWAGQQPETEDLLYPRASFLLQVYAQEDCELLDAAAAEPMYCRNEVTWKKIGEQ